MLRGLRVGLRAVEHDDLAALTRWWNDPDLWQLTGGRPRLLSEDQAERWFEDEQDRADLAEGRTLAIVDLEGAILGTMTYGSIDPRNRASEIGLFLGEREHRQKGLGSEALALLLGYLFRQLGVNRVSLEVHPENTAAVRCYEKAGFVKEGVLRQSRFYGGRFHDFVVMSVLADEWKEG